MKLNTLSLISHLATAGGAVAVTAVAVHGGGFSPGLLMAAAVGTALAVAAGRWVSTQLQRNVQGLRETVSARNWTNTQRLSIHEFDELAATLGEQGRRLSSTSVRAQEQIREIQNLLSQIDRRSASRTEPEHTAAGRLRELLSGLFGSADSDLSQALSLMDDIEENTQDMAGGASDQSEAVSKTTTYVEQMSANIDLVSQNAEVAHQAAGNVRKNAAEALELVQELSEGMEHIRQGVEAGWRKLRALGDRTQEIGSIVETIAGIAARTDMLALNASIESVRAGEHGRGFAVVADEVRKLAEQAADATKEVGGLIESVQAETQASIQVMAQEHAQVESEVKRVKAAGESLDRISHTSSDSVQRVGEISRAAEHQLRFTQEVVLAMERVSEVAKGIRRRAESVSWTTKSLSGLIRQIDSALSPWRACYDRQGGGDALRSEPNRRQRFQSQSATDERQSQSTNDGPDLAETVLHDTQRLLEQTQLETGTPREAHSDGQHAAEIDQKAATS